MNYFKALQIIAVVLVILTGCNHNGDLNLLAEDNQTIQKSKPVPKWQEISSPIYSDRIAFHGGKIFLIGTKGIGVLSENNNVKMVPGFKLSGEYITKDGGLTRETFDSKEWNSMPGADSPYLCSPNDAAFLSNSLYVFSICEHTAQLWKVIFGEQETVLTLTNFTYLDIDSGDNSVLGPRNVAASDKILLFPSFIKKGPALLTEDEKTGNLKVAWQGNPRDGRLISVDFIGNQGWMLFSGGKLFRSSDGGETWRYFSNIPSKAEYNVTYLKFRNELEGYIVGDNLILSTADGGKNWKVQDEKINNFLYKVVVDADTAAVSGDYGSLLINRKGEDKWTQIENKPDGDVRDLLIYNKKLYVLIEGKLYFMNLQ